jgi:hypothetical protein
VDPRTNTPFYVGKSQGARVLAHLGIQEDSRKARLTAELRAEQRRPRIDILVHDLPDEASAFRIEAAVIDALGLATLPNGVRGYGAEGRPLTEVIAEYQADPIEIAEPTLLIRINRRYAPAREDQALSEATRGVWRIGGAADPRRSSRWPSSARSCAPCTRLTSGTRRGPRPPSHATRRAWTA